MSAMIADNGNMIESLLLQTITMFNKIKTKHVKNDEVYLLSVNADTLFQDSSDPDITANVITNDLKQNLKLELHSPQNSDMRAILILNETKGQKKVNLKINAHIGRSKAFALLQFNYANMTVQNPMQLIYSANQLVDLNEKVDLVINPQDMIVVLAGTSNEMVDNEDTRVSLVFGDCSDGCSMGMILFGVSVIIIILVLIYLLSQSTDETVKTDFLYY